MSLSAKIKKLFCKHSFEKQYIPHGFSVVDGWMVHAFECRCSKCGKKQVEITKQKGGVE